LERDLEKRHLFSRMMLKLENRLLLLRTDLFSLKGDFEKRP